MRAQGGFIWDWVDQGLLRWVTNADGERVEAWAYGGDFGEPVHDAQFCINGLVFPNREPHPACHECKAVMVRAIACCALPRVSGSTAAPVAAALRRSLPLSSGLGAVCLQAQANFRCARFVKALQHQLVVLQS